MTPEHPLDIEQLLKDCAVEPIQFPGAIQPHGLLISLSEPDLTICQVSANLADYLDCPPEQVLGKPLEQLFGREALQQLLAFAGQNHNPVAEPYNLAFAGRRFDAILHRHDNALILELEPSAADAGAQAGNSGIFLAQTLRRLQAAGDLDSLYRISVEQIQAMTGFDRVLIYRFEDEGHGQVIAEASAPEMELFNGLFFPASDIPPQARELYRSNWLRIIPDAEYRPVPLIPQLRPDNGQPLDLSHAVLRSVSPIHCVYMKNMGVRASMSISLLKDGQLWGLISCGHRTPLHVPHSLRADCQTIGQVLSLQISALQELELARQRDAKLDLLARLDQAMAGKDVFESLSAHSRELLELTDAQGMALLLDNQLQLVGQCPTAEQVRALYGWLSAQGEPLFQTHRLPHLYAPAREYQQLASGVLAIRLSKPVDNALIWFRTEAREVMQWSGNPDKSLEIETTDSGMVLRPRASFEIWKQQMEGIARKWSHGELFAANDLRRSATEHDLARQVSLAQAAVRARDDLVAVVSHDLRNPMTVISMLCGMLQSLQLKESANFSRRIKSAIDTMQQASARMTTLLEDLLDTSKIEAGRYSISPRPLEVGQVFEQASSLLGPLALNKRIDLEFDGDTNLLIHADPERIFQVFSNLIGNAIKFTPELGRVSVVARQADGQVQFQVRDTGEGIEPEQLPNVFDRYWRLRDGNPSGSGLGLYISKGIIHAHGGEIQAQSQRGTGSVFSFTVPLASA
jgi:chemotaxis family two-component system sensor kinase Cph1